MDNPFADFEFDLGEQVQLVGGTLRGIVVELHLVMDEGGTKRCYTVSLADGDEVLLHESALETPPLEN